MTRPIIGRLIIDTAANMPPATPKNKNITFIATDTGEILTCDGQTWSSAGGASYAGVTSADPGITIQGTVSADNGQVVSDGGGSFVAQNAEIVQVLSAKALRASRVPFATITHDAGDASALVLPLTAPDAPTYNNHTVAFPVTLIGGSRLQTVLLWIKAGPGLTDDQARLTKLYVTVNGANGDGTPDVSNPVHCGNTISPISLSPTVFTRVRFPLQTIINTDDYPNGLMLTLDTATDDQTTPPADAVFLLAGHAAATPVQSYVSPAGDGTFASGGMVTTVSVLDATGNLKVEADELRVSDDLRVHGKFKTGDATAGALGAATGHYLPVYDESGTLIGGVDIKTVS